MLRIDVRARAQRARNGVKEGGLKAQYHGQIKTALLLAGWRWTSVGPLELELASESIQRKKTVNRTPVKFFLTFHYENMRASFKGERPLRFKKGGLERGAFVHKTFHVSRR